MKLLIQDDPRLPTPIASSIVSEFGGKMLTNGMARGQLANIQIIYMFIQDKLPLWHLSPLVVERSHLDPSEVLIHFRDNEVSGYRVFEESDNVGS